MKLTTKRQKQAMETKRKLLKAAEEVFFEQGFQKSTIQQIIKVAETGYGTAYVYFKNKDDFLIEIMQETMEEFYQVATLPFKPSTQLEAEQLIANQVKLFLSLALKNKELMKIMKEAIGVSEIVQDKWQTIRDRFISSITTDISFAQSQSLANKELVPSIVAKSWFYTNEMFMWELIESDNPNLDELVLHMTILYTRGLYTSV
ncbi:TetR/AcrR family transcriptional regulator [Halalkalibacter alkaliphilus]|uniref:TetR/AcrR family transcriptional regulator n=1 Tax=Halalkalibacter alkaliphilus TaxID=2917993 RepID=A0A9X2CV28_9BACI|nr:TetR/AcrR family transcriptional regulator [Halalkalibacter alkaliphilus]MCL7748562.1 TetR/AcrR family transcriptional regulator [Halalkalibacter alkaliphilus]